MNKSVSNLWFNTVGGDWGGGVKEYRPLGPLVSRGPQQVPGVHLRVSYGRRSSTHNNMRTYHTPLLLLFFVVCEAKQNEIPSALGAHEIDPMEESDR